MTFYTNKVIIIIIIIIDVTQKLTHKKYRSSDLNTKFTDSRTPATISLFIPLYSVD